MEVYKHHIVYKTTNTVNGKLYVGLHSTNNLNDSYLGSGWILKQAIEKYGRDKFIRTILLVLDSRDEARDIERLLVDQSFIDRPDTYNLTEGGMGVQDQWGEKNPMFGKSAINSKKVRATHKNGQSIEATSMEHLSALINIARGNIRELIRKQHYGRRGWKVEMVG